MVDGETVASAVGVWMAAASGRRKTSQGRCLNTANFQNSVLSFIQNLKRNLVSSVKKFLSSFVRLSSGEWSFHNKEGIH